MIKNIKSMNMRLLRLYFLIFLPISSLASKQSLSPSQALPDFENIPSKKAILLNQDNLLATFQEKNAQELKKMKETLDESIARQKILSKQIEDLKNWISDVTDAVNELVQDVKDEENERTAHGKGRAHMIDLDKKLGRQVFSKKYNNKDKILKKQEIKKPL
jgi:hypothetical protein